MHIEDVFIILYEVAESYGYDLTIHDEQDDILEIYLKKVSVSA